MLGQIGFASLTSIADLVAIDGIPVAGLGNEPKLFAEVEDFAIFGDAFSKNHVDIAAFKRRSDLVFDNFDFDGIANDIGARFDSFGAADIKTDGSIELQRAAAGRGLGVAINNANFFAELVDEDDNATGLVEDASDFAAALRH